jgi:hypothetical protein
LFAVPCASDGRPSVRIDADTLAVLLSGMAKESARKKLDA